MQVEPNGVVHLLENIPLNNTYQHTIRFTNTTYQYSWFYSKRAHTLNKMTYQRAESGVMRVQKSVDEVYKCNYLMFQNTGFASKWFYAFITGVEYVNNMTTEITYEIDVMQTWFVGCELKQCFIERSHTATDVAGDNIVAEEVDPGEYVITNTQQLIPDNDWRIVLMSTYAYVAEPTDGFHWREGFTSINPYGNTYTGFRIEVFPFTVAGAASINSLFAYEEGSFVDKVLGTGPTYPFTFNSNNVAGIVVMPNSLITELWSKSDQLEPPYNQKKVTYTLTYNKDAMFQGYGAQVKNQKLFTYPYSYLSLSNHQGDTEILPRENFSGTAATVSMCMDMSADPVIMCYPRNFKGQEDCVDDGIYLTDLPNVSYVGDGYRQWLAMHRNQLSLSAIGGLLSFATSVGSSASMMSAGASLAAALPGGPMALAGFAAAGAVGGAASSLAPVAKAMATAEDMKNTPNTLIGGKGSAGLLAAGALGLFCKNMCCKAARAKQIDNYFSMFGYAIKDVGTPNISSRPYWNYIKLSNPTITGPAPAQAISSIANILTNGITFWHNGDNVGDYSLDNSV